MVNNGDMTTGLKLGTSGQAVRRDLLTASGRSSSIKGAGLAVLLAALIILPHVVQDSYFVHLIILSLIYVILAVAWNVLGGYAGQFSFGHAAFFGMGAYGVILVLERSTLSPLSGFLGGALMSIVVVVPLAYLAIKLRGPYFALGTLAFAEVLKSVAVNWTGLTNGEVGISIMSFPTIALPLLPDIVFSNKPTYYYFALLIVVVELLLVYLIQRSKTGYYLLAIREDETTAESLGVHTARYKLIAAIVSGLFTSIGGSFYALYVLYVDPSSTMNVSLSIQMVLMVTVGGIGTMIGPIVGAIFLAVSSEYFRNVLREGNMLVYSAVLMFMVLFMPEGIVGAWKSGVRVISKRLGRESVD